MTKCPVLKKFNTCKYCEKIIALNKMEVIIIIIHISEFDYH